MRVDAGADRRSTSWRPVTTMSPTLLPATGPPRHGRAATAAPATSTTPPWPPQALRGQGSRASGDRRHRRPPRQRDADDLLRPGRRLLRLGPRRPGRWVVPALRRPRRRDRTRRRSGANRNIPLAEGTPRRPLARGVAALADDVRAYGATALVVSLGVDAAINDPESPLADHRRRLPSGGRTAGCAGTADRGAFRRAAITYPHWEDSSSRRSPDWRRVREHLGDHGGPDGGDGSHAARSRTVTGIGRHRRAAAGASAPQAPADRLGIEARITGRTRAPPSAKRRALFRPASRSRSVAAWYLVRGVDDIREPGRRSQPARACARCSVDHTVAPSVTATTSVYQPYLRASMDINQAWRRSSGRGVNVAVIDTGVDGTKTCPSFSWTRLRLGDSKAWRPQRARHFRRWGHRRPTEQCRGIAGVSRASILPVRVLDARGRGRDSDIARGIRWAANEGADIINMSLRRWTEPAASQGNAVRLRHPPGSLVIAAQRQQRRNAPDVPGRATPEAHRRRRPPTSTTG